MKMGREGERRVWNGRREEVYHGRKKREIKMRYEVEKEEM